MRQRMAEAEVGDDVYGDDPTIAQLEKYTAELLGKEAALFVVSGTMANQIAIILATRPGDEVIVHKYAHPAHHEAGAVGANAGVNLVFVSGEGGCIDIDEMEGFVRPDAHYLAQTSMLMVENTQNMAGGRVVPVDHMQKLYERAKAHELTVHLDGARIFNASVASGTPVQDFAACADTVSFCLSKGLGAPIGSMLCGSKETIRKARRTRTRLGGAWRQAGMLAAAGLYALETNIGGLAADHRRARVLSEAIEEFGVFSIPHPVDTNIIFMDTVQEGVLGGRELEAALKREGILANAVSPRGVRFVTHLGITDEDIEHTINALGRIIASG
ncbi:MAG: threonine aldolase [Myxococcales bacterium]|nr:threonine aldolase [Myxococcales bacterium]